ncbi:methyltransferase domain-containing protein [Streptomyces sp. 7R007]
MNRLRTRVSDLERRRRHHATARAVFGLLPEPESWLDVGTGDADFPQAARRFFPYTSFDGIDTTVRVLHAAEAERIEEAYAGQVTDPHIAEALRARYDVVTVLRAPSGTGELRAALALVRPGGLLLVETPAPDEIRAGLDDQPCTLLTPPRRPLDLGRLPSRTRRIVARRAPSPA